MIAIVMPDFVLQSDTAGHCLEKVLREYLPRKSYCLGVLLRSPYDSTECWSMMIGTSWDLGRTEVERKRLWLMSRANHVVRGLSSTLLFAALKKSLRSSKGHPGVWNRSINQNPSDETSWNCKPKLSNVRVGSTPTKYNCPSQTFYYLKMPFGCLHIWMPYATGRKHI